MLYKKYKPCALLKPFVSDYYIWKSEQSLPQPFSMNSPANNSFAMVFNYGDPYRLHNHLHKNSLLPAQFLSGQSTASYTLQLEGKIGMAGIIFHGSAFRKLFPTPHPVQFLDDRLDLTTLMGQEAAEINEQLAEANTDTSRIQILEWFLLRKLAKSTTGLTLADRAASIILEHRGMIRMDDLARQLYISPRQLRRTFKANVGINPKYFARLKRFSYVNWRLTLQPELSWQMFVLQDAFYDQSHFIKDYQEFFGKAPTIQIVENRQVVSELSY